MTLTYSNALSHFRNVNAEKGGFLWKFVGLYVLTMGVTQIAMTWMNMPIYEIYAEFVGDLATGGDPDPEDLNKSMRPYQAQSTLSSLVFYPLAYGLWVFLESALQRWYMKGEAFRLKFSADEGRMAVLGLIWVGFAVGAYVALIFAVMFSMLVIIPSAMASPVLAIILGVILGLAFSLFILFLMARFSAASALTIRDGAIRYFESWTVTRGRWGKMLGAFFTLYMISLLAVIAIYGIGFLVGYLQVEPFLRGEDTDVEAIADVLLSGSVTGPLALLMLSYTTLSGLFWAIWGGVGALAAKTDPSWVGNPDIVSEFS